MKNSPTKRPSSSIERGVLIQLGNHLVYCGSATNHKDVETLMQGQKIDLIATDPPYGVAVVESKEDLSSRHIPIANDQLQSHEQYVDFTRQWLTACQSHLADKNAFYIFNSDRMIHALLDGLKAEQFLFKQLLVWLKTSANIGRLDYLPQSELIAYGWHGTHKFYKSKDKNILIYPKTQNNKLHPTMKPVPLMRHLILNSSKVGATVYDPFSGSGSTLIAAEQAKRRCFAMELEPKYCQIIVDRFKKMTGIEPIFLTP